MGDHMKKKQRKYVKFLKMYNIIPLIFLVILMLGALINLPYIQNSDNRILFLIAFLALVYPLISNIERDGIKRAEKKVEHITATSIKGLEIELNKKLKECRQKKCANIEVHIIDNKNAFVIITD